MRHLLFAGAAALAVYASPSAAQQAISTPILQSVSNFRDVAGISASNGGTGFADTTANGGEMRTGVFYRSNALTLSAPDLATVSGLGITKDIDLRTPGEIAATPDVVPTGATYLNINILGAGSAATSSVATAKSSAEVVTAMEGMYRGFVTDPTDRAGFRDTLLQLANTPGAVLYHCTSGKDRTGWASAILQTIAGVSPDTIMKDYLATNSYSAGSLGILKLLPPSLAAIFGPALGVQASFLQASLDQVTASYGSMRAYLTQGLGLTQADIYVLRARMVEYPTLPGQAGMVGNAASGAALLNNLQNSPLSGAYTNFNFYLQSAIDSGTLGGVESRIGGQVHADTLSHLLREPQRINHAIRGYTSAQGIETGQTTVWQVDLGDTFRNSGGDGVASSRERSVGVLLGATRRFDAQNSGYLTAGYSWGKVSSADADADLRTFVTALGARHGFSSLDSGPYVAGDLQMELGDYDATRALGLNLGTVRGGSSGVAVYSARAELGDVIQHGSLRIAPYLGLETAYGDINGFTERGGELALTVPDNNHSMTDLQAGVELSGGGHRVGDWTLTPWGSAEYERLLTKPAVTSHASLSGFSVSQRAAFDSRDLGRFGLNLTAQRGALTVAGGLNAEVGSNSSNGGGGWVSVGYRF
jgi:protein tyrosine/serine phosphatase